MTPPSAGSRERTPRSRFAAAPGLRRLVRLVRGGCDDVLEFLYPRRCSQCEAVDATGRVLCAACWQRIPRAPLVLCARCLSREREPVGCVQHAGFRVAVAWIYDDAAAAVVHAFKFEGRTDLAPALGAELVGGHAFPGCDLVTEVPLHPARQRERGYNQAGLLAHDLSRRCRIPWQPGVLSRVRATSPQTRLSGRRRRQNLDSAFRVREPETLAGKRVLVVDDVMTTGATLAACLEALGRAGAHATAAAVAWAQ